MTHKRLNFLPGPVDVPQTVKEAFGGTPISHRSPEFLDSLKSVKEKLCSMTGALGAEVLMGSGTLANDAAAAQLSLLEGRGLVVTNGEFGERLLDHAGRTGLDFECLKYPWGEPFNYDHISGALKNNPEIKWIWTVHLETSTGVLNDIEKLKNICKKYRTLLALDCVSSIGTVPLDLRDVYIATGVSGKGLMSYPGLAIVLHNSDIIPTRGDIPRYIDLHQYSRRETVPYTVSSNLVSALKAALDTIDYNKRYRSIAEFSSWLRALLKESGFEQLSDSGSAAASVITIQLPDYISSRELGETLERGGYYIHHRSGYLESRNWVQISLMGQCGEPDLRSLIVRMRELLAKISTQDPVTSASVK